MHSDYWNHLATAASEAAVVPVKLEENEEEEEEIIVQVPSVVVRIEVLLLMFCPTFNLWYMVNTFK